MTRETYKRPEPTAMPGELEPRNVRVPAVDLPRAVAQPRNTFPLWARRYLEFVADACADLRELGVVGVPFAITTLLVFWIVVVPGVVLHRVWSA